MELANYWVYMLNCDNGTYYTGYTTQMEKRYEQHVDGTGRCKYTRSFKPLGIAQCWRINGNKALAMKIERFIKGLSRSQKDQLVAAPGLLLEQFPMVTIEVIA